MPPGKQTYICTHDKLHTCIYYWHTTVQCSQIYLNRILWLWAFVYSATDSRRYVGPSVMMSCVPYITNSNNTATELTKSVCLVKCCRIERATHTHTPTPHPPYTYITKEPKNRNRQTLGRDETPRRGGRVLTYSIINTHREYILLHNWPDSMCVFISGHHGNHLTPSQKPYTHILRDVK